MSSCNFAIVDFGLGNVKSVANAFSYLGYDANLTHDKHAVESADALILPGVGAFAEAMTNLKKSGLVDTIRKVVLDDKKPFLGICLGMQLIAEDSEEGDRQTRFKSEGLGLFPGHVKKIPVPPGVRLPHIGWHEITIRKQQPFLSNVKGDRCFYFVHSYHVECDADDVAATVNLGSTTVAAALQKDNIFATQFHPEKRQLTGLRLLRKFTEFAEDRANQTR